MDGARGRRDGCEGTDGTEIFMITVTFLPASPLHISLLFEGLSWIFELKARTQAVLTKG